MGLTRTTQTPTSIHRNVIASRIRRRDTTQIRSIWWWGKRGRGWFASEHDDVTDTMERLRRHQALMMHRYSKTMRRRAIWDRDNSPPLGRWRMQGCRWDRDMSSTDPARAKVEDREGKRKEEQLAWQEIHNDFESFKKAVDRAVARDPYGTLFGRRLRSPESANNASWTSWSWIFDPKEIKEEPKANDEKLDKEMRRRVDDKMAGMEAELRSRSKVDNRSNPPEAIAKTGRIIEETRASTNTAQPAIEHTSSSSKTTTSIKSSQSIVFKDSSSITTEYVYDPIAGRKVPKNPSQAVASEQTTAPPPPPSSPKQPSCTPKSAESKQKATQTQPVQQAAPPRGFLHTMFGEHGVDIPVKTYKPPKVYGFTGEPKAVPKTEDASSKKTKYGLENSKKREYDIMRINMIGNGIDANNFNCEPWNNRAPDPPKVEEAPATEQQAEKKPRTSIAPDEEAPLFSGTTYASKSMEKSAQKSDWLAKEGFRAKQGLTMPGLKDTAPVPTAKVEPAEKMQPALDRQSSAIAETNIATDIPVKKFGTKLQPAMDRVFPISTPKTTPVEPKPTRLTLSEKSDVRSQEKMEDIDLLRASDVRAATKPARITKQAIETQKLQDRRELEKDYETRKHDQDASGIDAKIATMASTSKGMTNIWKHIKDNPTGIVARTMQNLGLANTKEVVKAAITHTEKKSAAEPAVSTATLKPSSAEDQNLHELAAEMKQLYEQEHGKIQAPDAASTTILKPSRFSEPTVKPGIRRDLNMEKHTQVFEPKIAGIVDKAKSVKRELYEVSQGVGEVANKRAIDETAKKLRHDFEKTMDELKAVSQEVIPKLEDTTRRTTDTAPEQPNAEALRPEPTTAALGYAPYVILDRSTADGQVHVLPSGNVDFRSQQLQKVENILEFLGKVPNITPFLPHFTELGEKGYKLIRGNENELIFEKYRQWPQDQGLNASLRSTIARQEAAAQPAPSSTSPKEAAKVLDEIPATIPVPGPTAPSAPSSTPSTTTSPSAPLSNSQPSSTSQTSQSPRPTPPQPQQSTEADLIARIESHRTTKKAQSPSPLLRNRTTMKKTEPIFSGQQRLKPQLTGLPDPEHFQKQNPASSSYQNNNYEEEIPSPEPQLSWFARVRRFVRRTILTGLAFGVGAYGIGVVAEGLQARAQISQGEGSGPMRRLVLEREDEARRTEREMQRVGKES